MSKLRKRPPDLGNQPVDEQRDNARNRTQYDVFCVGLPGCRHPELDSLDASEIQRYHSAGLRLTGYYRVIQIRDLQRCGLPVRRRRTDITI